MKKRDHSGLRTWIEIDTKAIRSNYRVFRKFIPKDVRIMGVVKSNAYGHNLTEFAFVLEKIGVDMLAVDSIIEALSLRTSGIKTPILVLGYTLPEMFVKAAGKNIHVTISSAEGLKVFLKTPNSKNIPIHIKVDTGMHRQGFLFSEVESTLKMIDATKINIAGLYTHFAVAKNPSNTAFTDMQFGEFMRWRTAFQELGFSPIVHAGATGGTFVFSKAYFDMVRIGIGLYGVWPSEEIKRSFEEKFPLKPVLSWKTIISEIKIIPKDSGVGYDLTYRVQRPTRMAVCPIGYWHGYPRALGSAEPRLGRKLKSAEVLVNGKRAPVLGRVSMDMIVIDITDIPNVKVGDEVVLIGRSGKEEITADELARRAGTSAYEILTRLNPLMRRIYR